jgi:hypothetical protein
MIPHLLPGEKSDPEDEAAERARDQLPTYCQQRAWLIDVVTGLQ